MVNGSTGRRALCAVIVVVAIAAGAGVAVSQNTTPTQRAPAKSAQQIALSGDGEDVTLNVGAEGMLLEEMLAQWTATTGRRFAYPEGSRLRGVVVRVTGVVTVKKAAADAMLESILVGHGFCLEPIVPPEANVFRVESIAEGRAVRQNAPFVPQERLADLQAAPARVFMTFIRTHGVDATTVCGAIQHCLSQRNAEFAFLLGTRGFLVVGFGPTLAAIGSVVDAMEAASAPADDPASNGSKERQSASGESGGRTSEGEPKPVERPVKRAKRESR